jgi:hypothetical protein
MIKHHVFTHNRLVAELRPELELHVSASFSVGLPTSENFYVRMMAVAASPSSLGTTPLSFNPSIPSPDEPP